MSRFDDWEFARPERSTGNGAGLSSQANPSAPAGLESFANTLPDSLTGILLAKIDSLETDIRENVAATTGNVVPDLQGAIAKAIL